MIQTLIVTIVIECAIIIAYFHWHKKPVRATLYTSLGINLATQPLLWIALNLFFHHYLLTLLAGEIVVWFIESLLLYVVLANQLRFRQAVLLSLGMNMTSFVLGWFLPV